MTTGCHDRLTSVAAVRRRETAPVPASPATRAPRRPDLSAPFTVTLMAGFTSAALFLSLVLRHDVPIGRILRLAAADPFGALALALLVAAGVMARIGDI
jgi:hypothetical protein